MKEQMREAFEAGMENKFLSTAPNGEYILANIAHDEKVFNRGYQAALSAVPAELSSNPLQLPEHDPIEITDSMAYAFHRTFTDGSISESELEETKNGLRAAFCNLTLQAQQPVKQESSTLDCVKVTTGNHDRQQETMTDNSKEGGDK